MNSDLQVKPLVRFLCIPDVDDRPIGGVKQIYRHVEHLCALGWDAAVLTETQGFKPSWFASQAPTISISNAHSLGELSSSGCILVLPETFISTNLSCILGYDLSKLPTVVFNQNAYYTYGQIHEGTALEIQRFYDNAQLLQVLAISEDTHAFLSRNLGLSDVMLSRIINAIEPTFVNDHPKSDLIHWMPRKNPEHVQAILLGIQRIQLKYGQGWQAAPLFNLSHSQVADRLNRSRIFLSFGHPEGFGLPIAEAMASGCYVIGYSGGGGRELFGFGTSQEINFGDWTSYLTAIKDVLIRFTEQPREMAFLLQRNSHAVRNLYSFDQERQSIALAWERIEQAFFSWREYQ
ncbi:glycosyltransferase [Prochlorococcus marinus]|uniref:Glycosyl transferase family 1 domain-containing protein n=1 Tax=Prochlorococcus marinus (strain MIT 9303) TaxID=59922 RepID=A2C5X3_PROM3|nr:glycosyltransferase [Prochlorococcus marinus]ABM76883.1 Hypothetical protein P9303_01281 [Prochlorococcus marinus str. MIT 9303]